MFGYTYTSLAPGTESSSHRAAFEFHARERPRRDVTADLHEAGAAAAGNRADEPEPAAAHGTEAAIGPRARSLPRLVAHPEDRAEQILRIGRLPREAYRHIKGEQHRG